MSNNIKKVFFVGAGISVNPPTNFPTAFNLVSDLLKIISPNKKTYEKVIILVDSKRSDKRNPNDFIRFELLLDKIQQIADTDLNLLSLVNLFNEPNEFHNLLAHQAIKGNIVITTNFDCLIEKAVLEFGEKPFSVCKISEFETWKKYYQNSRIPIFKLHGSYYQYDGNILKNAIETIQATLSTITAGNNDLILPQEKLNFLKEITNNREIIIAGYSGSDDLDIMPSFRYLDFSSLIWLEYKTNIFKPRNIKKQYEAKLKKSETNALTLKDKFFLSTFQNKFDILQIYKCDTYNYLKSYLNYKQKNLLYKKDYKKKKELSIFFYNWSQKYLKSNHIKFLLIGDLMRSLARYDDAYDCFRKAYKICKLNSISENLSQIAYLKSRVLVDLGLREKAEHWIKEAISNLKFNINPFTEALCLHQYGYSLYKLGRLKDSLEWYEKCADFCIFKKIHTVLSYSYHEIAIIYQDHADFKKAKYYYKKSIELSSKVGDIKHLSFTYHQLGILYFEICDFIKSEKYLQKSLEISNLLGDFDQVGNSLYELALIEFHRGNIVNCIKQIKKTLNIDKRTGRNEYTPISLQQMGISFMEVGKLKSAEKFFKKAEKGYLNLGDYLTLSELYSYYAILYLELQNYEYAAEKADKSLELANKYGVTSFLSRAKFVQGICYYLSKNVDTGIYQIFNAIDFTLNNNNRDVLLDQIYYCAKYRLTHIIYHDYFKSVKWVLNMYSKLNNKYRHNIIEKSLVFSQKN